MIIEEKRIGPPDRRRRSARSIALKGVAINLAMFVLGALFAAFAVGGNR